MPSARLLVVIDSSGYIVIESDFESGAPFASITCAVKLYVPEVVGVPLIPPVDVFSARPGGRLPAVMPHV